MVRRTGFFKIRDPKTKTFKAYNTGYSQSVSHPGTNLALQGLTVGDRTRTGTLSVMWS